MGNLSSILTAANGEKVYAFDQSIPRDRRAPERTLRFKFYVASDGSITSETSARFQDARSEQLTRGSTTVLLPRGTHSVKPRGTKVCEYSLHPR